MCLTIKTNPVFIAPKAKAITVYKVYNYTLINGEIHVTGLHYGKKGYRLKKHLTIVSNRGDRCGYAGPTNSEIANGRINKGLHAWVSKDKALRALSFNQIAVEFVAKSSEFVARGVHGDVVYHKLIVNKIIAVSTRAYDKYGFSRLVKNRKIPVEISNCFKTDFSFSTTKV